MSTMAASAAVFLMSGTASGKEQLDPCFASLHPRPPPPGWLPLRTFWSSGLPQQRSSSSARRAVRQTISLGL
jgi:hypothetical protein